MDVNLIQTIEKKGVNKSIVNNESSWDITDNYTTDISTPAILVTMTNGNLRLSIANKILINPAEKTVISNITEYIKTPEDQVYSEYIPTGVFNNQRIVISNDFYCLADGSGVTNKQGAYEYTVDENNNVVYGDIKAGYSPLYDFYFNNVAYNSNIALFQTLIDSMYERWIVKKNGETILN